MFYALILSFKRIFIHKNSIFAIFFMNVSPISVTIKPTNLSVTSVLYGCTPMLFT